VRARDEPLGSASTSVLDSPRRWCPASSKRAVTHGRWPPLKETARIVSIALPFRQNRRAAYERFYSGWPFVPLLNLARLAANPGRRRVERARQASEPLTFQELTELRRKTEAVSKFLQEQLAAHWRPAPGDLTRAGVQQVPRNQSDHGFRIAPSPPAATATGRSRASPSTSRRSSIAVADAGREPPGASSLGVRTRDQDGPRDQDDHDGLARSLVLTFTSTYGLSQMRQGSPARRAARRAHPPVRRQRAGRQAR